MVMKDETRIMLEKGPRCIDGVIRGIDFPKTFASSAYQMLSCSHDRRQEILSIFRKRKHRKRKKTIIDTYLRRCYVWKRGVIVALDDRR